MKFQLSIDVDLDNLATVINALGALGITPDVQPITLKPPVQRQLIGQTAAAPQAQIGKKLIKLKTKRKLGSSDGGTTLNSTLLTFASQQLRTRKQLMQRARSLGYKTSGVSGNLRQLVADGRMFRHGRGLYGAFPAAGQTNGAAAH